MKVVPDAPRSLIDHHVPALLKCVPLRRPQPGDSEVAISDVRSSEVRDLVRFDIIDTPSFNFSTGRLLQATPLPFFTTPTAPLPSTLG